MVGSILSPTDNYTLDFSQDSFDTTRFPDIQSPDFEEVKKNIVSLSHYERGSENVYIGLIKDEKGYRPVEITEIAGISEFRVLENNHWANRHDLYAATEALQDLNTRYDHADYTFKGGTIYKDKGLAAYQANYENFSDFIHEDETFLSNVKKNGITLDFRQSGKDSYIVALYKDENGKKCQIPLNISRGTQELRGGGTRPSPLPEEYNHFMHVVGKEINQRNSAREHLVSQNIAESRAKHVQATPMIDTLKDVREIARSYEGNQPVVESQSSGIDLPMLKTVREVKEIADSHENKKSSSLLGAHRDLSAPFMKSSGVQKEGLLVESASPSFLQNLKKLVVVNPFKIDEASPAFAKTKEIFKSLVHQGCQFFSTSKDFDADLQNLGVPKERLVSVKSLENLVQRLSVPARAVFEKTANAIEKSLAFDYSAVASAPYGQDVAKRSALAAGLMEARHEGVVLSPEASVVSKSFDQALRNAGSTVKELKFPEDFAKKPTLSSPILAQSVIMKLAEPIHKEAVKQQDLKTPSKQKSVERV